MLGILMLRVLEFELLVLRLLVLENICIKGACTRSIYIISPYARGLLVREVYTSRACFWTSCIYIILLKNVYLV